MFKYSVGTTFNKNTYPLTLLYSKKLPFNNEKPLIRRTLSFLFQDFLKLLDNKFFFSEPTFLHFAHKSIYFETSLINQIINYTNLQHKTLKQQSKLTDNFLTAFFSFFFYFKKRNITNNDEKNVLKVNLFKQFYKTFSKNIGLIV